MTDSPTPPQPEQAGPGQLDTELVDIATLVNDQRNPRKGKTAEIVKSLREFGQHRLIVVQRSTRKIIAGNHTVAAAKLLGWKQINVVWVDDDDRTAIRRALADNFTGMAGSMDEDVLRELLEEVADVPVPGLDDKALERMLREVDAKPPEPTYPIVAEAGEQYDYVMIVARNEIDCAWLQARFGLRREASYKSQNVGLSRVVTVDRLRQEWAETEKA